MKKDMLKKWAAAASDACNRKRDTIFYFGATATTTLLALTGKVTPAEAAQMTTGATFMRELIRMNGWELAGGRREAASARWVVMHVGAAHMMMTGIVGGFDMSVATHAFTSMGAPAFCLMMGEVINRGHMLGGPRGVLKMYQDKLWNWPDKRDPKPPAPKKSLAERVREGLARPIPVPT